jgi:hypothetical protein
MNREVKDKEMSRGLGSRVESSKFRMKGFGHKH